MTIFVLKLSWCGILSGRLVPICSELELEFQSNLCCLCDLVVYSEHVAETVAETGHSPTISHPTNR